MVCQNLWEAESGRLAPKVDVPRGSSCASRQQRCDSTTQLPGVMLYALTSVLVMMWLNIVYTALLCARRLCSIFLAFAEL
jgi:hypothetical protein